MDQSRLERVRRQQLLTERMLGVQAVPRWLARLPDEQQATGHAPVAAQPMRQQSAGRATQSVGRAVVTPAASSGHAPAAVPDAASVPRSTATSPPKPAERPRLAVYGDALPREQKMQRLAEMDENEVKPCQNCGLCRGRINTVFGEGDPDAPIMFVGEGPGQDEDMQGRPFVGRAGTLLDQMIRAMGYSREQVYIANIVKCRPPNNRTPGLEEVEACWPYLLRQIEVIRPGVLVALGGPASKKLLETSVGITRLRGTWGWFNRVSPAIPVMPTFHPAYLLRAYTPDNRRRVWNDLQQVMALVRGDQAAG